MCESFLFGVSFMGVPLSTCVWIISVWCVFHGCAVVHLCVDHFCLVSLSWVCRCPLVCESFLFGVSFMGVPLSTCVWIISVWCIFHGCAVVHLCVPTDGGDDVLDNEEYAEFMKSMGEYE